MLRFQSYLYSCILFLVILSISHCFPIQLPVYSSIWVDANVNNTNCTEIGFTSDCACNNISQALSLVNETFRIIEILGSVQSYKEQLLFTSDYGSNPIILRGSVGNYPTLTCPDKNATIVIQNATVYMQNIQISNCIIRNKIFKSISNLSSSGCSTLLSSKESIKNEWLELRDSVQTKAIRLSSFLESLEYIWELPTSLQNKSLLYHELLQDYRDNLTDNPKESGHSNNTRPYPMKYNTDSYSQLYSEIYATQSFTLEDTIREHIDIYTMDSAIFVEGGVLAMTNVSFTNNTGTLLISDPKDEYTKNVLVFQEVEITNNTLEFGYGFVILNSTIDVLNSKYSFNEGKAPMNIFGHCTVKISNTNFLSNNVSKGGLFLYSNFSVNNCEFEDNKSGSLLEIVDSAGTIFNSTFRNNNPNDNVWGTVVSFDSNLLISDSKFIGNVNQYCSSSAIAFRSIAFDYYQLTISNSQFINNTAIDSNGGAASILGGRISINNSYFESNSATNGGGVYACGKYHRISSLDISNTTFYNNTAILGGGGFFTEYCDSTANILSNQFLYNIASREGGGIRYTNTDYNRSININGTYFTQNYASFGGGIFISGGKYHTISNNHLANNYASFGGGVVVQSTVNLSHLHNLIEKNYAVVNGGGTYLDTSYDINIDSDNYTMNFVNVRDGGGMYLQRTSGYIVNSTFLSNFAPFGDGGGILFSYFNNITIKESIFDINGARRGSAISSDADSRLFITDSEMKGQWSSIGSIFISGSTNATLLKVSVHDNNSTSWAGGIALMGRSTTFIRECTISNNIADTSGGGLHIGGLIKALITNSTISFNRCSSSGGGVIITDMANVTFSNTIISNNTANSSGGGIIVASLSKPVFNNCSILGNTGHSSGGGATMLDRSNTSFVNCIISDNFTPNVGGGIAFTDQSLGNLESCIISRNTAGSDGGAIASTVSASITISDCTISSNTANSRGGGITISDFSVTTIINSFITNNFAISGGGIEVFDKVTVYITDSNLSFNNATTQGGAISASDYSTGALRNLTIISNVSRKGGAILASQYAEINVYDSFLKNNSANIGGGFVYSGRSKGGMNNCTLQYNYADYGGAIVCEDLSAPSISESNIIDNYAAVGGGIYIRDKASPSIGTTYFSNNFAHQNGGAIAMQDFSTAEIFNCLLEKNYAYKGGSLYLSQLVNATLVDLFVRENNATFGGGMFVYSSLSRFHNISISENSCTENGGGIYIFVDQVSGDLNLENILVLRNYANQGGGIYVLTVNAAPQVPSNQSPTESDKPYATLANFVLLENRALNGGGVFYTQFGSQNISFNGRINGNTASGYGGAIFIEVEPTGTVPSFVHGTYFMNNYASIGGGSFATNSIYPFNSSICSQCFFVNNTGGYQTPQGFCSVPHTVLGLSYPQTLTLNNETFSVSAILQDSFNSTVVGPYFKDMYLIGLYASDSSCILSFPDNSYSYAYVDEKTGLALFYDAVLQGKNNTSCTLIFNTTTESELLPSISQSTIKIDLYGCNSTTDTIHASQTLNIDYCGPEGGFWTLENIFIAVILALLLLVFLMLVWMIVLVINLKRGKKKKPKENFKDIPDFDGRPKITLQEILNDPQILVIPWEHLQQGDRLGIGAGGVVYSGTWQINGSTESERKVAMKQVLLCRPENITADLMHQFLIEIKLLSALKHKHIVELIGVSSPFANELYLITELMTRGSVDDVIDQKRDNLPPSLRMKLLIDAAKGVVYLHERNVIHRDLKPSNFLVDENWNCKVADLGVSTIKPALTKTLTVVGTPVYMAPEILLNRKYSESCDVYSFGIMMGEIFLGKKPYSSQESNDLLQAQLLYKICNEGLRPSTSGLPPALKQLAIECWNGEPQQRPSMSEVLNRLKRITNELSKASKKMDKKNKKNKKNKKTKGENQSLVTPDSETTIN